MRKTEKEIAFRQKRFGIKPNAPKERNPFGKDACMAKKQQPAAPPTKKRTLYPFFPLVKRKLVSTMAIMASSVRVSSSTTEIHFW